MPAGTAISVEEYLRTTYRPDCDYVDGEVIERNLGEYDHARLQTVLAAFFFALDAKSNTRAVVEQRVHVTLTRFRIPDVCVVGKGVVEQIVTHPPLLCIEILSKDDTVTSLHDRIQDYLGMGVPAVWVLDPKSRRGYIYRPGMHMDEAADGVMRAPNPGHDHIEIALIDLFRD